MISKRDARYADHPVAGERCDGCTMFRDPNRCTLVSGRILPDGHCQYWEPKKTVKSFADLIIKNEPSVGDVHVTTALDNQSPQRRRYKPFSAFVSGGPKKPSDGPSTFGPSPVITATSKQFGTPNAPPFPTDLGFLSRLHGPQVPAFLWALTHRDALPKVRVPMDQLVAIQDRINPQNVESDEKNPPTQRPTVVKLHGVHYIADGHDRLSARMDEGKTHAKVRLFDIDHPMNPAALKKDWSTPFRIEKADMDKQQLFGWASVVTKNGRAVIDKQNDIIPVDELEKAAYDFVLESRKQGDMHSRTEGVGKMIESMVFTAEKQKALGVDLGMEGWWIGFQCDCKDLWKDVKSGKKLEFSIGGAAIPEKVSY